MEANLRNILVWLESLPAEDKVHGSPVKSIAAILRASIELNEKQLEEQKIHIPQGGRGKYLAPRS
jgi:hypothetical protein